MNAKVTVLIPTYNRREMLLEALESLECQTMKDFEVHIYDDGSNDGTNTAIGMLQSYGPLRISYTYAYQYRRSGVSVARAHLLRVVSTPYFTWLDSDDKCAPDRLEKQVAYLEAHPEKKLVQTNIDWYDAKFEKVIRQSIINPDEYDHTFDDPFKGKVLACATTMARSELKNIRYNLNKTTGEDTDWLIQVLKKYPGSFGHINESLYYGRVHNERLSVYKRRRK